MYASPSVTVSTSGTLRDLGHYAVGMEQALAACTVQLEEIGGLLAPVP